MQEARSFVAPTLRRVWTDYRQARRLKPITEKNYQQRLNQYLKDWLDVPVNLISKDMVESRHKEISGEAMANSVMRTLRALLHFASVKYPGRSGLPIIPSNPVSRLSELRQWYPDKRRSTCIAPAQLPNWFRAVFALESQTVRDLLLLLLFTGLRKTEATDLRWKDLDLNAGLFTIPETKTGGAFTAPFPDYMWRILRMRRLWSQTSWVFPGPDREQPIRLGTNTYGAVAHSSGVKFTPHDLRRTFASMGDLVEVRSEVVAALLNHAPATMTETYIIRSPERLRRASNAIAAGLIRYGELRTL